MRAPLFIVLIFVSCQGFSQDIEYVRHVTDTLTSPYMHGRGYVMKGDSIAASYIAGEFEKLGLIPINGNYCQKFPMAINTFPDTLEVSINGRNLTPGIDFTIFSSSPGLTGDFELVWRMNDTLPDIFNSLDFDAFDFEEKVVLTALPQKSFYNENPYHSKGVVFLNKNKVWWHVSIANKVNDFFALQVSENSIDRFDTSLSIKVNNQFYPEYVTQNVVGMIEGKTQPDSFFVISAHYDHLGRMGKETYFPGANDNASGTAFLLDLARYFSSNENQPEQSILFISFGAEEAGLLGSKWYANHPLLPLNAIRFLINVDMVGSGSEGIKVVNGTEFKEAFDHLATLNDSNQYIPAVKKRGPAANSDHYPFYEKGVPGFFIYTLGQECKEYHNIYDVKENTPFTVYNEFFTLITHFIETY